MSYRQYINHPDKIGVCKSSNHNTHKVGLYFFNLPNQEDNNFTVEIVIKNNGENKRYTKKFPFTEAGYTKADMEFIMQDHKPNIEGYNAV